VAVAPAAEVVEVAGVAQAEAAPAEAVAEVEAVAPGAAVAEEVEAVAPGAVVAVVAVAEVAPAVPAAGEREAPVEREVEATMQAVQEAEEASPEV
jgi:hypothetical protein